MKQKITRGNFHKKRLIILINILFLLLLLLSFHILYIFIHKIILKIILLNGDLSNIIGILISAFIAFIPYFILLRKRIKIFYIKFLQQIYFFEYHSNKKGLSNSRQYYIGQEYHHMTTQNEIINRTIKCIDEEQKVKLFISGSECVGKTTTSLFFMNQIGHNKTIYNIFYKIDNNIIYFDSIYNLDSLLLYLNKKEEDRDYVIIIDNIHKYSLNYIKDIIEIINNYFVRKQRSIILWIIYQSFEKKSNTLLYIKELLQIDDKNYYEINDKFPNIALYPKCKKLDDFINHEKDKTIRNHLRTLNITNDKDKFLKILYGILNCSEQVDTQLDEKLLFFFTGLIYLSSYFGYVTENILYDLCKRKYNNILAFKRYLRTFTKKNFLIPFPFMEGTFLLNENIARKYRSKLSNNNIIKEFTSYIAESLFSNCDAKIYDMKWLFFVGCSVEICSKETENELIKLFQNVLMKYNLNYILKILEFEIQLEPLKRQIFRKELGIIYIYTGEWKKAQEILYSVIETNNNKNFWPIQLKLVETEHGTLGNHVLEMLDYMEAECKDNNILFQIRYWRQHIYMEKGNFDMHIWEQLSEELLTEEKRLFFQNDIHFCTRIVSDYERTYFLNGEINYFKYKKINSLYFNLNTNDLDFPEIMLSKAYYIQYDILFQLGIWGYIKYSNINKDIIDEVVYSDDNNTIQKLIETATNIYNTCIDRYESAGKKKYKTLKVRNAELSLCFDSNQYIKVLETYSEFSKYAHDNNITLFEAYCNTQQGKALALYAISQFSKQDMCSNQELFKSSKKYLQEAKDIYNEYGNQYGEMRAELLLILIDMIMSKTNYEATKYKLKYSKQLADLSKKYNIENKYYRELHIIEKLQDDIISLSLPQNVIRYYPIILQ